MHLIFTFPHVEDKLGAENLNVRVLRKDVDGLVSGEPPLLPHGVDLEEGGHLDLLVDALAVEVEPQEFGGVLHLFVREHVGILVIQDQIGVVNSPSRGSSRKYSTIIRGSAQELLINLLSLVATSSMHWMRVSSMGLFPLQLEELVELAAIAVDQEDLLVLWLQSGEFGEIVLQLF